MKPSAFDPRRLAGLASRLAPQSDDARGAAETTGPAGQAQLEAVLAELERAAQLPPDQQISVYESVHRTLQETLRSIEQS
ncbi:hypothetical protein GCM10009835_53050 [Planosporangium flavigriseum]